MNRNRVLLVFFSLALLLGTSVAAQRLTGSLSGVVTDPQGAAIPGAKITIVNPERNFNLSLETGEDGRFVAPDLAPANYTVRIEASGFKTLQTTATVRVGVDTGANGRLEIGTTETVITVEGGALTVDTQRPAVQGVVTPERIQNLPLNGRNFLDLAQQEPGVQIVDGGSFDPTKNQFVGVSVGGRSGRSARIQVDGVDITDETVGTTVANISNESIQEFNLSQSTLDPSTDVTSSGGVNIITRSGTNDLHGSAAFFWRDESFAADPRLVKPNDDKPPFDRQIVAARAGGPIFRDRLFWHAEYEYNNQDQQQVVNTPQFPQFSGAFGVPLDERLAGGRADWVINDRLRAFYRFQHNHNFGVTGFGGTDLAAFANRNDTNQHVAGVDFSAGRCSSTSRETQMSLSSLR